MDKTAIYRGPLEEFVARRSALVRELRASDPDAATAAGKLRKPSVGSWAIDQLSTDAPELITALLAAGVDAKDAHHNAAAGTESREDLLAASARLRDAVEAAARAAVDVLERAGHTASEETRRRVRTTLQAAATGSAVERQSVWRGTLDRDLEMAGFGAADHPDSDVAELAAMLAPLRRRPVSPPHEPARARTRDDSDVIARRDAERDAANKDAAAERARALADAKRSHAERIANEARLADEEAMAAEQAATAAEEAARAAQVAKDR